MESEGNGKAMGSGGERKTSAFGGRWICLVSQRMPYKRLTVFEQLFIRDDSGKLRRYL
jgi:hypothetical protein